MFLTVTDKLSFKPTINRPIVEIDVIVAVRLEFVWIENLDGSFVPSSSNGFALAEIYFDMDHFMRERFQFRVRVSCAIEH